MFDFDKNDYHVKETGRDFWGNRKYEIIEKPKGGGCVGIIIVFALLFYLAKGCNGNSSANTDEVNQSTPYTSEESGTSGTSGESGTSGTSGESGTSGTSGESGTSGTSGESGTSGTSGESGTENENDQITDQKVLELFDKYSNSETDANEKDIIKMISKELIISKLKVKKVLKKSGKL